MKRLRTMALLLVCLFLAGCAEEPAEITFQDAGYTKALETVEAFADKMGMSVEQWPKSLIALLGRNPETEGFVLSYPVEFNKTHEVDISDYAQMEGVPLFMQWDRRWGYITYGSDVAGLTGCGPVCLSMAAYAVTRDPSMSPDRMMQFAIEEGYCVPGNGTAWALFGEGAAKLGLTVRELPLEESVIVSTLQAGIPVVCIMGPGDFTSSGHYIVLREVKDGMLYVNDPNSYANSKTPWRFADISDQIRNLWAISA